MKDCLHIDQEPKQKEAEERNVKLVWSVDEVLADARRRATVVSGSVDHGDLIKTLEK